MGEESVEEEEDVDVGVGVGFLGLYMMVVTRRLTPSIYVVFYLSILPLYKC